MGNRIRNATAERAEYQGPPIFETRAEISRGIRGRWRSIAAAAAARGATRAALAKLPKTAVSILGESLKVEKGETLNVLTAVVYLAPSRESGRDMCPNAVAACRAACLGHSSGRMRFDSAKNSRGWKTALWFGDRAAFVNLLRLEIMTHAARAQRLRMIPAIRFDGTSDTGFGETLAREFPNVQFYDYTKNGKRFFRDNETGAAAAIETGAGIDAAAFPANYTLVYSHVPGREHISRAILAAGFAVAVVFRGAAPETYFGFPVIDGDATDVRFFDSRAPVIVGLSLKGPKPKRTGARGFAV